MPPTLLAMLPLKLPVIAFSALSQAALGRSFKMQAALKLDASCAGVEEAEAITLLAADCLKSSRQR